MRRALLLLAAAVSLVALTATFVFVRERFADAEPYAPPQASAEDLTSVSQARVFFAHQSVGYDILDSLPEVYESHQVTPPTVVDLAHARPDDHLLHVEVGQNGDPLGKIAEFDHLIRGGLGDELDVAVLKLCYLDVRAGTDVDAVFRTYRETLAKLQSDYPDVKFVAATVPVSVRRGPLGTLKGWLGQGDSLGSEHNVARQEFNALIRHEYADANQLFDIAAIESTTVEGERVAGTHSGSLYYALDTGLARDAAHLNDVGGAIAAESFIAVVADALRG